MKISFQPNQPQAATIAALTVIFVCLFFQAGNLHITGFEHRSNDEYLYFKSTHEMLSSGNYLSPTFFGEHRFEKPILFYWFIILFYKIFGVSWAAARWVSVLFAFLSVSFTWLISRQFFDRKSSFLSCILLMTMPLFFAHTRTAVPDMTLNFFVVMGFYALIKFVLSSKRIYSVLLFIACGLGFMVKGFPALIPLIALVIYALWSRKYSLFREAGWIRGLLLLFLIIAPWFLYMIHLHGKLFLDHVLTQEVENRIINTEQGHVIARGIGFMIHNFFYYVGVIWNNLAPWSLFLFAGLPFIFWRQRQEGEEQTALRFLLSCMLGVLFLFVCVAMEQYNVQYMLMLSTPAAILSAHILLLPLEGDGRLKRALRFLKKFICLFIFTVGFWLFGYFMTFFATVNQLIVGACVIAVYILALVSTRKIRDAIWPPLLLGFLIVFVTSNMSFFAKNRLSVISSLEVAANVIKEDRKDKQTLIGISDSIDPKKFWVFFEQPVEQGRLSELFVNETPAYVVITAHQLKTEEEDSDIFNAIERGDTADLPAGHYEIIWQDRIMAKKLSLDKDFFKALLRFDRNTVDKYILEDIYIIKKT